MPDDRRRNPRSESRWIHSPDGCPINGSEERMFLHLSHSVGSTQPLLGIEYKQSPDEVFSIFREIFRKVIVKFCNLLEDEVFVRCSKGRLSANELV